MKRIMKFSDVLTRTKLFVKTLGMGVIVFLLSACTNDVVPVDATLELTPANHSIEVTERINAVGQCLSDANSYLDIPILMQLSTSNGSPIGDAMVSVYADFSDNTYSGNGVLSIYDDVNGNGVIDADSELVSGELDDIAQVRTASYTGSRMLLLRVNLSCGFRGEIRAFAGAVHSTAVISVIGQETVLVTNEIEEETL